MKYPELAELLRQARAKLKAMTPEEREALYCKQRDRWVRSEMQWTKDFREGKCERD